MGIQIHKWLKAAGFLFLAGTTQAQVAGFITVDQFGYRPDAVKTAVLRDPQLGLDASLSYTPGTSIQVVDSASGTVVFTGTATAFNGGAVDAASGDKIWWFDFSSVTDPGRYYILDSQNSIKSFSFSIAADIYNDVLKHAMRMFFYQRVGFAKEATYAGAAWADGASHLGTGQDSQARSFFAKSDAGTARDLRGGWYDAGDYNKYTPWTSNYVEAMLLAFLDRPAAFTDDYNIPESGNGVPDIIDEAKWGMDHLLRMQNADGSVLSVVGLAGKSPPSSTTAASYYGPANALSGWASAKAFALGAQVFLRLGKKPYADSLIAAALKAWNWSEAHPDSLFHNNNATYNSSGLAAGDQEDETDYSRLEYRALAGMYLYEYTGDSKYLKVFEDNYESFPLFMWSATMDQYRHGQHLMYLHYLKANYGNATIKSDIQSVLIQAFNKTSNFAGKYASDGYRSYIKDYNWGSNKYKSDYGLTFGLWAEQNLEPAKSATYGKVAEDYLHYIHGTNPLDMVYLTNMNAYGASRSLTSIYHTWFTDGSAKWDAVGKSTYGPAPGYLAGGANSSYKWDACCDGQTCGSTSNNAKCFVDTIPVGAPAAKMYKDFNTSWPMNSWEITEPSNGYQISYIRLLSRFVEERGQPLPILNPTKSKSNLSLQRAIQGNKLQVVAGFEFTQLRIVDMQGRQLEAWNGKAQQMQLDLHHMPAGIYTLTAQGTHGMQSTRFVKP